MTQFGYWVDLRGITFAEGDRRLWLQAFPLGTYKHPLYGKLAMTSEKAARMAANVKNRTRGTDLDIDYDHKEYSGRAAGWIRDAEARNDGLWVNVEFTEEGHKAIQQGEYRYFSPEYVDQWKHPQTGAVHEDVLFGGALTNRPFLKDILPINMSELSGEGGNEVNEFLEKLRKIYKLSEDATEEEILAAASKGPDLPEDKEEDEDEEDNEESEDETQLKELSEKNPLIAKILADNKKMQDQVEALAASNKLAEVKNKLSDWRKPSDGRKYALPPACYEDLQTVMLTENGKSAKALLDFVDTILKSGLVKLTEEGGHPKDPIRLGAGGSASKQFNDRVEEVRKQHTDMDMISAMSLVAQEEPELYQQRIEEVLTDQAEV